MNFNQLSESEQNVVKVVIASQILDDVANNIKADMPLYTELSPFQERIDTIYLYLIGHGFPMSLQEALVKEIKTNQAFATAMNQLFNKACESLNS